MEGIVSSILSPQVVSGKGTQKRLGEGKDIDKRAKREGMRQCKTADAGRG